MLIVAVSLALVSQDAPLLEVSGNDAGLRIVRSRGELHSEIFLIGDGDEKRVIAVSTSHPALRLLRPKFQSFRSLKLTAFEENQDGVVLRGDEYELLITVPDEGGTFHFDAKVRAGRSVRDAMVGFALFPNSENTIATRTFAPAGEGTDFITLERFMTPIVAASGKDGGLALIADVSSYKDGLQFPPVLHIDTFGNSAKTPIVGYGFAPYDRDENWAAKSAERTLLSTADLDWSFDLIVSDDDVFEQAAELMWSKMGKARSVSPFPQSTPFRYYTKPTYSLKKSRLDHHLPEGAGSLWWTSKIAGIPVRAPNGVLGQGRIDTDHNLARFAWGMRWWGERLLQGSWAKNSGEVMNLVLSAPAVGEFMPVSFDLATKSWQMEPTDLSAIAQTGRWMLKYAEEFDEYERSDELTARAVMIANVILQDHPTGLGTLFLLEVEESSLIEDQPLKDSINSYLLEWTDDLRELARLLDRQGAGASAESVATALVLVESGDAESIAAGKQLITRIFLNQALYTPPMYSGTPIFGAHVSDKVLRQEQSVYSFDLLRATMKIGDRALVERAIATLRSPLALFNGFAHIISGIKFPEDLASDRIYPWYGAKGRDERGNWQSPADGTGQLLASFAETLDTFGSVYTHKSGWTIGIDGIHATDSKDIYNAFSLNRRPFAAQFHYVHVDGATGRRTDGIDPPHFPIVSDVKLSLQKDEEFVVAIPGFVVTDARSSLSGSFAFSDGSTTKAEFLPIGFGAKTTAEQLMIGPVTFSGLWRETDISFPAQRLLSSPPSPDMLYGWTRKQGLMDVMRCSVVMRSGTVVSTADNGRREMDPALTGSIDSHPFLLTDSGLKFTMHGTVDKNVFIELIEDGTSAPLLFARKVNDESEDVSWEVREHIGKSVVFRLVDESKTSSISIENLRSAKVGPD